MLRIATASRTVLHQRNQEYPPDHHQGIPHPTLARTFNTGNLRLKKLKATVSRRPRALKFRRPQKRPSLEQHQRRLVFKQQDLAVCPSFLKGINNELLAEVEFRSSRNGKSIPTRHWKLLPYPSYHLSQEIQEILFEEDNIMQCWCAWR